MKKQIILDTDIGTDIDDIIALYYILKSKKFEVVGITTVYENPRLRARYVKKLLLLAGVNVPVYAGYGEPMEKCSFYQGENATYSFGREDLYDEKYRPDNKNEADGEEAVDFLIEQAEQRGNLLTVVGIGPFTNIARAIEKKPLAMNKLKKIVIMGGDYVNPTQEWNIICDIKAAKILFMSGVNLHCVGLNVTLKTEISYKTQQKLYYGSSICPLTHFLYEEIHSFIDYWDRNIILHDALAIHYLLSPQEMLVKNLPIYLEAEGVCGKGVTFDCSDSIFLQALREKTKECSCVMAIDKRSFMNTMEKVLLSDLQPEK